MVLPSSKSIDNILKLWIISFILNLAKIILLNK